MIPLVPTAFILTFNSLWPSSPVWQLWDLRRSVIRNLVLASSVSCCHIADLCRCQDPGALSVTELCEPLLSPQALRWKGSKISQCTTPLLSKWISFRVSCGILHFLAGNRMQEGSGMDGLRRWQDGMWHIYDASRKSQAFTIRLSSEDPCIYV